MGLPLSPVRESEAQPETSAALLYQVNQEQDAMGCIASPRSPRGPHSAVSPTALTTEAFSAGAHVATGHVFAGAAVDTRVRLTLVVVDVTVCPTPPRGAVTLVPTQKTELQPGLRAHHLLGHS